MLKVLRRAYLQAALAAVTIGGLGLMLLGVVSFTVYARHSLHDIARSLAHEAEQAASVGDRATVEHILAATGTIGNLVRAIAVDRNGQVVAGWRRSPEEPSSSWPLAVTRRLLGLPGTAPIVHAGQEIGEIRLWSSGAWLLWFLVAGIGHVLACQCLVVVSAFLLSERILGRIVEPLRAMVAVTHAVRRERSFARRVPPAGISELNALATDFNALLGELESWRNAVERERAVLQHQAHHDSLTGLPHRIVFEQRLYQAIADAAQNGSRAAVLYVDVDRFKEINDRFGHAAGDLVLTQIATRIRNRLRETDLVARLGGDEFAVLIVPAGQATDLRRVADAIQEGVRVPIRLPDGNEVTPCLSIGIGIFPDDGNHPDAVMRGADLAMYLAKRAGRAPTSATTDP